MIMAKELIDVKKLLIKILKKLWILSSADESFKEVLVGDYTQRAKQENTSLTASSSDDLWLKAAMKAICIDYAAEVDWHNLGTGIVFKGKLCPNSQGYFEVYIYDVRNTHISSGLPEYCNGTWRKWQNTFAIFSTNAYTFSYVAK